MKSWRSWLPYAVLLPLCALLSFVVAHGTVQRALPTPIHKLAAGGVDPYAFYANERARHRFWINDPTYCSGGAVGDDSHDDTVCFTAALSDAVSKHGAVYLAQPATAYKTTSEIQTSPSVSVVCDAPPGGQCTIRAHASMRSVLSVYSTIDVLTVHWVQPNWIVGLALDANNVASYGLLENAAAQSHIERVSAFNAVLDGFHALGHRLPMLFGSVTTAGGAPAGLTVSQPDTGFTALSPGATNIVVKIQPGGTTYVASFDGGVTFATATQNIVSGGLSNLFVASLGTFLHWSGIQLSFPSASFPSGGTWSFTATVQTEDTGQANAINAETRIYDCWADTYGYVTNTGNATSVAASQTITGTGTSWLTGFTGKQGRPGDAFSIGGVTVPILGVADDATIIVATADAGLLANASAAAYNLAVGYGFYQDNSGDEARQVIEAGRAVGGPNGVRLVGASDGAASFGTMRIDSPIASNAGIGLLLGGDQQVPSGFDIHALEVKPLFGARIYVQSGVSGTISEIRQQIHPTNAADVTGPGTIGIRLNGSLLRYSAAFSNEQGSSITQPISSLDIPPVPVAVTSANQVISAPDMNTDAPNNPTYIQLQPNADYVGSNSIFLQQPHAVGQHLFLENSPTTTFYVGLEDNSLLGGSNSQLPGAGMVLAGGERTQCVAVIYANVFQPRWHCDKPRRVYVGPGFEGSGNGESSWYAKTTNTTVTKLAEWDYTFGPSRGWVQQCFVQATDMTTGDFYGWQDVQFSFVPGTGLLNSGNMTVGHQWGTLSAGTWAITIANETSEYIRLKVQDTSGSGHTVKWWADCAQHAAPRF